MLNYDTDEIVFHVFRTFLLVSIGIQPLILIINYATQNNEQANFTFLYFVDKLLISGAFFIVYTITKTIKKIAIIFATNIIMAIVLLELLSYSLPKFVGYFSFFMILSFNKSLSLITRIKFATYTIINASIFTYAVIRTFLYKLQDSSFPIFYSLILIIEYIITEVPTYSLFYKYDKFMKHQDHMLNDFKAIVYLIPYPLVIYDTITKNIILSNKVAQAMLNSSMLQNVIAFALQSPIPSTNLKCTHIGLCYSVTTCLFDTKCLNHKSVIISAVDITDVSHFERKAANEDAMWLFINAANHQIRTPLSGIESSLNIVQAAIDSNDLLAIKSTVEVATLSVVMLRHLFDDTLLFYEDKENKIVIANEEFKMVEISLFLKQVFAFETNGKNLKFIIEYEDCNVPLIIVGDKKRILHIVYTVIANAFKYTLAGEIIFTYQILTTDFTTNLTMKISDTGIGIENEEIKCMFNVFQNSKRSKSEENTSTGISLHIARRLCSLMGGEIIVHSQKGIGTVFFITIPIRSCIGRQLHHMKTSDCAPSPIFNSNSLVLVVDDNATNLFVLSAMLAKLNITYEEAHNGKEAVDMFSEGNFKLVLMDINMPVMNGFEASKNIKKIQHNKIQKAKVIAVSAQDLPLNEKTMKECEIEKWITKPVKMDVLKDILKEFGILKV